MREYTLEKALSLPHLSSFNRSTVITELGLYEDVVIDTYDVRYNKIITPEGMISEKFLSGKDANVWFSIRVNNDPFMLPCVTCEQEQAFKDEIKRIEIRYTTQYENEEYVSTILSDIPGVMSTFAKNESDLKNEQITCAQRCMNDVLSDSVIHREYVCVLNPEHKISVSFVVEKLKLKNTVPVIVAEYQKKLAESNAMVEENDMPEEVREYYKKIKKISGYVILRKIGQYPSMADMQFFECTKYRRILKSHYRDYSLALGLFSSGVGCGSFIYLRRIFEFLVERIHEECISEDGWNEEEYKKLSFNERIQALEKFGKVIIPNELAQIRMKIYGVLSKGVHQSSDQECLELFEYVKYAIEMIMDEQLAQLEKKEKIKEIQKKLGSF